ncbi:MAG: hypothetical protein GW921_06355, partial [Gallionella sp.]|nr:hypothetical protein [Gallionella sp.]
PVLDALWELQRRCGQPEVVARPLFAEIVQALEGVLVSREVRVAESGSPFALGTF